AVWVRLAQHDLEHRDLLWTKLNDYARDICWLSHQTCEKYLKALLVSRDSHPARTHELPLLLAALRATGLDLTALEADCALLAEHAVDPRYPEGLQLGAEDARAASEAAERVVRAVLALLPPSLR